LAVPTALGLGVLGVWLFADKPGYTVLAVISPFGRIQRESNRNGGHACRTGRVPQTLPTSPYRVLIARSDPHRCLESHTYMHGS